METWRLVVTPNNSGLTNMQTDFKMFGDFERGLIPSTLRIYSWEPNCISLGYSQGIDQEIDVEQAAALGWDVVKRPTGGGIVFHNEAEVTYSLVTGIDNPKLPKGLVPSYKKISEAIVFALKNLGISAEIGNSECGVRNSHLCFSYPTEYEIVMEGKKIVGGAQKRGKRALLQQGSIFVRNMSNGEFSLLKKPGKEYNAVSVEEVLGREVGFDEMSQALIKGFGESLDIDFEGD